MKRLILILMFALLCSPAWCADEWLKTRPATTDQWTAYPVDGQANNAALDRLLANYREGMTLSYSSATTIAVSAGEVVCSTAAGDVRKMRQNTSATNVTFSDIDTGAEEASKQYYLFANCDADATTATFKVSLSSTSPTGVTHFKRIGSFYNDASSNITTVTNDSSPVMVATGTIASGATISLPTGYAQDQCKWTVSINSLVTGRDCYGGPAVGNTTSSVSANASRVVTISSGSHCASSTGTANYLIICNK
jgi:hypothetical protein